MCPAIPKRCDVSSGHASIIYELLLARRESRLRHLHEQAPSHHISQWLRGVVFPQLGDDAIPASNREIAEQLHSGSLRQQKLIPLSCIRVQRVHGSDAHKLKRRPVHDTDPAIVVIAPTI